MAIPMLTIEALQRDGTWSVIARVAPWEDADAALAKWRRWHPHTAFRFRQ